MKLVRQRVRKVEKFIRVLRDWLSVEMCAS